MGGAEELTSDPYPANRAPTFANDTVARSFTETVGDAAVATSGNVGAVVTATDEDGDMLTYTLEGTDAAKFGIVSTSGQITTKVREKYDREAKASYSVTVKASDANGGSETIAVTITVNNAVEKPLAPGMPTVTATAGITTSLDVRWTAPANAGRPPISGYKLRYRTGSGAWTDHAAGSGSTSTAAATAPGAPRDLAAAGDERVTLSWSAPARDGGGAITTYRYWYAAGSTVPSGVSWRDVPDGSDAGASTVDERGVTVTRLVNERQYAFEVQAVNSSGDGPAAGPATATPRAGCSCARAEQGTPGTPGTQGTDLSPSPESPARHGTGRMSRRPLRPTYRCAWARWGCAG